MVATRRTPKKNRSPSPSPLPDGGSTRGARKTKRKSTKKPSKEEEIAMGQRSPSPRPRKRPEEYPEAVDEWRTEWSEKFGEWYWWHEKTMQVSWLHPVSGKFPDGSEPDSDERAQNEDIMKATLPAEPQPEPELEPQEEPQDEHNVRRLLVLCFILAVAYLASEGELQPLWDKLLPHLKPLLDVVARNGTIVESGGTN